MADEKKDDKRVSVEEVRRTVSSSLAAAFGFVIGLVWSQVVLGGFAVGGINLTAQNAVGNWGGWGIFVVVATAVTVVMVLLIVLISRWGATGVRGMRRRT